MPMSLCVCARTRACTWRDDARARLCADTVKLWILMASILMAYQEQTAAAQVGDGSIGSRSRADEVYYVQFGDCGKEALPSAAQ